MSDDYTPTMERVEDLYAWAVAWNASPDPGLRADLVALAERQRAEFQRALAARDDDALCYIDKTIDNVLDVPDSVWRSDEIVLMLRDLRRILVPELPDEGSD